MNHLILHPTIAQTNTTRNDTPIFDNLLPIILPIVLVIGSSSLLIWFIKSFLCICKPNEILILSGRKHQAPDGSEVGYRVLCGGRAIRIPILETAKRMKVTTMPVRVEVKNAYSKGGTPLNIQAIANVKISSNPKNVGNAIERFLNCDQSELARVAKETLEGYLRGVVATLTPEELNEDRLSFAQRIALDVERDLSKLGLQLDTLKVQSVSDDVDYLSSLGRKQIAMIIRDAEIAESDAISQAEQVEAQCDEQAQVAQKHDQTLILEKENELRKLKAKLEQRAKSEEEITIATAAEKRAKAEQILQSFRAELEKLRLEAETILPAQAQQKAQEYKSKGQSAYLEENAKAEALVNDMLTQIWQELDQDAAEFFLVQQLEIVLRQAVEIPQRLHLKKINMIDNGQGSTIASLVNIYPEIISNFLKQADQNLGIRLTKSLGEAHPGNAAIVPQVIAD